MRSGGASCGRPAIEQLTSPADVAEIVAFMASDEAKLLKGTVFTG